MSITSRKHIYTLMIASVLGGSLLIGCGDGKKKDVRVRKTIPSANAGDKAKNQDKEAASAGDVAAKSADIDALQKVDEDFAASGEWIDLSAMPVGEYKLTAATTRFSFIQGNENVEAIRENDIVDGQIAGVKSNKVVGIMTNEVDAGYSVEIPVSLNVTEGWNAARTGGVFKTLHTQVVKTSMEDKLSDGKATDGTSIIEALAAGGSKGSDGKISFVSQDQKANIGVIKVSATQVRMLVSIEEEYEEGKAAPKENEENPPAKLKVRQVQLTFEVTGK